MSDQKKDYEVGYAKPPKSGQFKKGQSGNAKGRPKGAKGVRASLKRELNSKITVREGNREVRISKAEAMAKQLMANGLKGDKQAQMAILKLDLELFSAETDGAETEMATEEPKPVDYDILRDFFADEPATEEPACEDEGEHLRHWEMADGES
ncbi:DUF5681 domain-containing protein [uncultured Shimia sp.]|uniref:DUF5681 domain-containing protein n=1 Tax=uncultured Shimia sp. TaxID=573152 RepID=UPI002635494D|nr:DUF5681 domain-containing protein [uncultured Shimia sp.]